MLTEKMGMLLSGARLEIANLRVFILMPFYFDFNARPKCVRRFLIFLPVPSIVVLAQPVSGILATKCCEIFIYFD